MGKGERAIMAVDDKGIFQGFMVGRTNYEIKLDCHNAGLRPFGRPIPRQHLTNMPSYARQYEKRKKDKELMRQ